MGWRNAGFTAVALVAASLLAGASVALARTTSAAPPGCSAGTTAAPVSGPVCGVTADGQTSYLDIPYAAPPIASLRWQPPQPAVPWTTTYQATELGPQLSAAQAFSLGRVNKVPLMIGVGRDEFNGGIYTPAVVADSAAQYQRLARQQFGALAPSVMRLYPVQRYPSPSPFIAYRTIMADAFSVCPALVSDAQLSRVIPVYAYEDDDSDSPADGATQPFGAYHSAINRLVHADPASLDADQATLQSQVLAQWTGFARDGLPTVNGAPLWTTYPAVMSLVSAGDSALVPASTLMAQHNCGFWDSRQRTFPG
jgi:carboxylesterase type B